MTYLADYSTKEKAVKVLQMIQEAYDACHARATKWGADFKGHEDDMIRHIEGMKEIAIGVWNRRTMNETD